MINMPYNKKNYYTSSAPVVSWPYNFALQDEIFDMVKPADPLKITLQDLINRLGFIPLWQKVICNRFIHIIILYTIINLLE